WYNNSCIASTLAACKVLAGTSLGGPVNFFFITERGSAPRDFKEPQWTSAGQRIGTFYPTDSFHTFNHVYFGHGEALSDVTNLLQLDLSFFRYRATLISMLRHSCSEFANIPGARSAIANILGQTYWPEEGTQVSSVALRANQTCSTEVSGQFWGLGKN